MRQKTLALLLPALLGIAAVKPAAPPGSVRVYVGTYTSGESRGIYRLRLDLATGALSPEGQPTEAVSPSFLAWAPDGRHLYAVNETGDARTDPPGGVSAFKVDPKTGALTFLNRESSGGAAPCHLAVTKDGRHVLVANYWGGNVAVFAVGADGRLGARTAFVQHEGVNATPRDPGPHAHAVVFDPAERYVIVADLGLDKLFAYPFDAQKGTLGEPKTFVLAGGAGPRHLAFHPDGTHAYVINELDSTITALVYADGTFRELQTIMTVPAGYPDPNSTAEIAVSADGKYVYGSNRGQDTIAMFNLDPGSFKLGPMGAQPTQGKHPRHFAIDPTGAYLLVANRDSDNVVVFRITPTGTLTPVGEPVRVPRPVCLLMWPER